MTYLSTSTLPALDKHLSHPKYRADIDGLRALAVLSVVTFHAFPSLIQGGFVGVDVFFVISGYLISSIIFGSLEKNRFSFLEFYGRRVNRIFPALLLMLSATWAFGWFSLMVDEYSQLGKHIAGGSAFVSNFLLLGESGYFDNSAETKPLLHLWSLGIEEQFYLVWPLLVWAAWKSRVNILILIALIGGISFTLNIIGVKTNQIATFYSPQTRFWELLIGSLLAYATLNQQRLFPRWRESSGPAVRNLLSVLGMALVATALVRTTKNNEFPGWWAILPTVGAALVIAAGPFAWLNKTVLSSRIMVFFGLISFPLYLWHWPLLTFARMMYSDTPSAFVRIAAVLIGVLLAWLTYRFVERPIRSKLNIRASVALLSFALVGVGICGYATFRSDGIPSRFPAEIRAIADFKYEFVTDARYPQCWLSATDPYDGFAAECLSGNSPGEGVLLWGDSHAARLYPGIAAEMGRSEAILQTTRSSCPPILDFGDSICQESNRYILAKLRSVKPRTVVLFGAWGRYGADWSAGSADQARLMRTIDEVSAAGITNIVLLGPAPVWLDSLPKHVYQAWKSDFPQHQIPRRLASNLNPDIPKIESEFTNAYSNSKAAFVSLLDILCNTEGCLTHTTDDATTLTTWDYGHLTTAGAIFVAERLHQAITPGRTGHAAD
ncbi:Peptidoglycan/LPS O-acetylase OafA/YrhL, contains acyltransferase and SGNH-hydrolase domains [Pseudomonas japonica]|uniref:Peptidoglycan/LPS O-acetylase OafA/YrhL, contains acyltransferase and SGNH-hydrolase domains n=2 Tax=Pseudomonas japonica TaxID=256466 RepID=A0A239BVA4_9PSED|nr:Peptidoglycan/LPS O-acetylase OafA/YrhL, contains acyltransferase and SGNH-hydrolase domains [Pseudomonas japonica]